MKVKFVLLAVLALFIFIACGDKKDEPQDQPDPRTQQRDIDKPTKVSDNEFVDKAGGFAVEFPDQPERMTQSVPTEVGDIEMVYYQSMNASGEVVFMVSYNDYPAELVEMGDPDNMLEEGKNGALGTIAGAKVISSKKIEYDGNPGIEFYATGDSQGYAVAVKARMYLVGNRLYQVMILGLEGTADEDEMDDFLDTFRLL
ncbi:MAG: hypothetical protein JW866_04475 [Ignavibacteriales bacterium]|nr:hypothetical protein [Ignavibacteriales bacterium]